MKLLLGFRKLSVVILAITLSTIFLLTHHIDGKNYSDIMTGVVVAFMASNAGTHLMEMVKEYFKNTKDK